MTRDQAHEALDEALDELGVGGTTMKWGSVTIEIKYESGRAVIRVRERETIKPIKGE